MNKIDHVAPEVGVSETAAEILTPLEIARREYLRLTEAATKELMAAVAPIRARLAENQKLAAELNEAIANDLVALRGFEKQANELKVDIGVGNQKVVTGERVCSRCKLNGHNSRTCKATIEA